ncbi:hypothetical protein ANCCEY_09917 [Ancylostoma ceylanicum]|uniref:Uncharacterized protein n=1 Tax=Ancylostoma ceylanicum TaxID=53326 RepID=A0A0D6LIH7_9BILA|nr:hypothetical protein ANCCEY_09917 [Ancylostoma ceylanicum]
MASVYFGAAGASGGGGAQSQYIGVGGAAPKVGGGVPAPAGVPAGGAGATSAYIGVGAGGAAAPGAQSAYFAPNPTAAGTPPVGGAPREFFLFAVPPNPNESMFCFSSSPGSRSLDHDSRWRCCRRNRSGSQHDERPRSRAGQERASDLGSYEIIEDVVKKTKNTKLHAHLFNTTFSPA